MPTDIDADRLRAHAVRHQEHIGLSPEDIAAWRFAFPPGLVIMILDELLRARMAASDGALERIVELEAENAAIERLTAENERLRAALAIIKPDQVASQYQCVACDATMQRWQDFPEYQHAGCGGLVRLAALIQRDSARRQLAVVAAARDEACCLALEWIDGDFHSDVLRIASLRKAGQ